MVPLLSPQFRSVIDEVAADADVQWVYSTLNDAAGGSEERWIPHFPHERDILDIERTDWGPSGLPIRWELSPEKVATVAITALPQMYGELIVNAELMTAITVAGLTGFAATTARMGPG